ncbi:MAG TPA: class I SAM-dependent methyltransferase [Acidobacteriota bacterium]|nr:class I SAM-dependent methyltransferase [Acidobacteriota bacterium]
MGYGEDELRKLYKDFCSAEATHWTGANDLQPVEKEIFEREITKGPVLDAGCGIGRTFAYFERRGIDLVGMDAVPEMIGRAREHDPLADLVEGELPEIARLFAEDYFAAVICIGNAIGGLLTEEERNDFVHGVARVLCPGGRFFLDYRPADIEEALSLGNEIVIDNSSRGGGYGAIFEEELGGREHRCYQYYLTEQEISGLLAGAGFSFRFVQVPWLEFGFEMTMAICRLT